MVQIRALGRREMAKALVRDNGAPTFAVSYLGDRRDKRLSLALEKGDRSYVAVNAGYYRAVL